MCVCGGGLLIWQLWMLKLSDRLGHCARLKEEEAKVKRLIFFTPWCQLGCHTSCKKEKVKKSSDAAYFGVIKATPRSLARLLFILLFFRFTHQTWFWAPGARVVRLASRLVWHFRKQMSHIRVAWKWSFRNRKFDLFVFLEIETDLDCTHQNVCWFL